jgi:type I restriction-modification system DNA methylase subunit
LPANLFYGKGIPSSIIIIDKEDADKPKDIFTVFDNKFTVGLKSSVEIDVKM